MPRTQRGVDDYIAGNFRHANFPKKSPTGSAFVEALERKGIATATLVTKRKPEDEPEPKPETFPSEDTLSELEYLS